jgi:hypothetical protein
MTSGQNILIENALHMNLLCILPFVEMFKFEVLLCLKLFLISIAMKII